MPDHHTPYNRSGGQKYDPASSLARNMFRSQAVKRTYTTSVDGGPWRKASATAATRAEGEAKIRKKYSGQSVAFK